MSQVSVTDRDFPLEMPICIRYRPSLKVAVANAFVHLGAAGSLFAADIPPGIILFITGCVLLHLFYDIRRYLIHCKTRTALKLDGDNQWEWTGPNGETRRLDLLPGTFVHPRLVILRFRDECRGMHTYVFTTDNIGRQTLRRLRVRLRFP